MKYSILITLFFMSIIGQASFCSKNDDEGVPDINTGNIDTIMGSKIKITVNSQFFLVELFDNNSAKAFKEILPMTIDMIELNGNEKYYDLPENLPAKSSNTGSIHKGDLMLYGSNTLVLFYQTFSTTFSYTKLGRIDDTSGLTSALGSGNVTVKFELE